MKRDDHNDIKKELMKYQKKVDKARTEIGRLEGREKYLLEQLKTQHDINSIDEIDEEIERMEEERSDISEQIKRGTSEIRKRIAQIEREEDDEEDE